MKALVAMGMLAVASVGVARAGVYAEWSMASRLTGNATFGSAAGMPDARFTLQGDLTPGGTQVTSELFEFLEWETLFGEGDGAQSLQFRSDNGNGGVITVSRLVLTFDAPTNPQGTWAFAVTDLEVEDTLVEASIGGASIQPEIVATWFRGLFDSRDGETHLPSGFDAANVAVVAEFDSDGLLSDELLCCSSESASAWFMPDRPIDMLTIIYRNRAASATGSMHFYMAVAPRVFSPGDNDGDGDVGINDLNNVRNNFGLSGPDNGTLAGDAFPFDGMVNIDDLNSVRNNFGAVAPGAVPEPSGLLLVAIGALLLALRRRRR